MGSGRRWQNRWLWFSLAVSCGSQGLHDAGFSVVLHEPAPVQQELGLARGWYVAQSLAAGAPSAASICRGKHRGISLHLLTCLNWKGDWHNRFLPGMTTESPITSALSKNRVFPRARKHTWTTCPTITGAISSPTISKPTRPASQVSLKRSSISGTVSLRPPRALATVLQETRLGNHPRAQMSLFKTKSSSQRCLRALPQWQCRLGATKQISFLRTRLDRSTRLCHSMEGLERWRLASWGVVRWWWARLVQLSPTVRPTGWRITMLGLGGLDDGNSLSRVPNVCPSTANKDPDTSSTPSIFRECGWYSSVGVPWNVDRNIIIVASSLLFGVLSRRATREGNVCQGLCPISTCNAIIQRLALKLSPEAYWLHVRRQLHAMTFLTEIGSAPVSRL